MIQVSILFRNNVHKEHPSTIKIGYFTTWREKFQHGFLGSSRKSEMSADTHATDVVPLPIRAGGNVEK